MTDRKPLKVVMEVTLAEFDTHTLAWLEELKDKAIEQGEVTLFKLYNIPSVVDLK